MDVYLRLRAYHSCCAATGFLRTTSEIFFAGGRARTIVNSSRGHVRILLVRGRVARSSFSGDDRKWGERAGEAMCVKIVRERILRVIEVFFPAPAVRLDSFVEFTANAQIVVRVWAVIGVVNPHVEHTRLYRYCSCLYYRVCLN